MVRAFLLMLSILALASPSFAKIESGSVTAQSVVAYGAYGSTIVPLAVDADGNIYIGGSPTLDNLTVSGASSLGSLTVTGAATIGENLIVQGSVYATDLSLTAVGESTFGGGIVNFSSSTDGRGYLGGVGDVYVQDDVEVDGSAYFGEAKAITGFRNLCIDSVGKIFSVLSSNTCGFGT